MSSEPVAEDIAAVNSQKLENAIRAFQEKKPVPDIDFTVYTKVLVTGITALHIRGYIQFCLIRIRIFSIVSLLSTDSRHLISD
ncbi:hypothetical protein V1507DRAFT_462069 [Lipomyces tetrasporus]